MTSGSWGSIVTIELGGETRGYARITSIRGAASYLIDQWPGSRNHAYRDAVVSCTKALKGELGDEVALTTFLRAATMSGLRYMSRPEATIDPFEAAIMDIARQSVTSDYHQATWQRD